MFAHQLFRTQGAAGLKALTGRSHRLEAFLVAASRRLAPWFLFAAVFLLFAALGWPALLFAPIFLLGYFLFSLKSIQGDGIAFPSAILAGSLALSLLPEAPQELSRFLLAFALALFANRFHWWFAERVLLRHAALAHRFGQGRPNPQGEPEVQEAEVIEVSDA
jgi:hypothetical protein